MGKAVSEYQAGSSQGPATDRHNEPVVDPTKNVLDLVDQAIKRQDDMREAFEKRLIEQIALRADYDEKLRKAESERIDAIRAVDVGNVQRAAEVQATQALALANQVVATASALETKLGATVAPLQTRIDDLTRVQYEGVGSKTQVVESQASTSNLTAIVGAVLAVIVFVGGFLAVTQTNNSPPAEPVIVTVTQP